MKINRRKKEFRGNIVACKKKKLKILKYFQKDRIFVNKIYKKEGQGIVNSFWKLKDIVQ